MQYLRQRITQRPIILLAILGGLAAVIISAVLAINVFGAVGGGGKGGACASYCSANGYGWYMFGLSDNGPNGVINGYTGEQWWTDRKADCSADGADKVMVYIVLGNDGLPANSKSWDYKLEHYSPSMLSPEAYNGTDPLPWVHTPTAKTYYDALPASEKVGYTWGTNVSWFCYDTSKDWNLIGVSQIRKNAAAYGTAAISAAPGDVINWRHTLRNPGPDPTDTAVTSRVYKSGFSNGWNATNNPVVSHPAPRAASAVPFYTLQPNSAYTVYTVTQADVGNNLCQSLNWYPDNSNLSFSDPANFGVSSVACSSVPYNYTLTPTISGITNGDSVESSSGNINGVNGIIGNVSNIGSVTKSHPNIQWQITETRYASGVTSPSAAGGISASIPCTYYSSNNGCTVLASGTEASGYSNSTAQNYAANATVGDLPVGTKICFSMSIRRNSSSNADWRHSQLYCLVVGKRPKVNVLGGDLIVGRTIAGNVPVVTSSDVTTSVTRSASTNLYYGSWSEYGIISSGIVTGMASGSGFVGGSASTNVNAANLKLLTFSNNNSSVCGGNPGCYLSGSLGLSSPNIASRFPVNASTNEADGDNDGVADITTMATGLYKYTGASNTLVLNGGVIDAGKWVVINAPTKNVVINSNISYTTNALTGVADIPQVVIIANNILISDSVTNVDAWLIATGSGTEGRINTCVVGGVDQNPLLNANVCNQPLRVNGPVAANHLLMYRTAGAGTGTAAGDPAEVFNLRADAYIWATAYTPGTGRLQTVNATELPPRF